MMVLLLIDVEENPLRHVRYSSARGPTATGTSIFNARDDGLNETIATLRWT
jgi:hypothetical protein